MLPSTSAASSCSSPNISLSKRTSSRNAFTSAHSTSPAFNLHSGRDHSSPPSTPPNRSASHRRRRAAAVAATNKGKQPMRGPASAQQSSSIARRAQGLSWSSTTRDSVVDNLLLSLDNLPSRPDLDRSRSIPDDDFDRDRFRIPSIPQLPNYQAKTRPRGHTYSSSLSSGNYPDHPPQAQDSPASLYHTPRRSHRSNSGTISTIAVDQRSGAPSRSKSSTFTQSQIGFANGDLDSTDYHQFREQSRLALVGRKSVSMDQIYSEGMSSVLDRGRPVASVHSVYEAPPDAAPEPTIAAGPRNAQHPTATGPVYVNLAPKQSALRKITTQGDLRSASKQDLSHNPPIPQDYRHQASEFIADNNTRGGPLQQSQASPMHSPRLPSSHQKESSSLRDRPGFFKRVFGGGSSRNVSIASDRGGDSFDYQDKVPVAPLRTKSQAGLGSQAKTEVLQGSKEAMPSNVLSSDAASPPPQPPALNKKPSSFFRRRKKSTSENTIAPPLPLINKATAISDSAKPSPSISSLRKVMDPFLSTEDGTNGKRDVTSRPTTGSRTLDSEDLDIFHSGYTPPPDSTLAIRNTVSRQSSQKTTKEDGILDGPHSKLKVKKRAMGNGSSKFRSTPLAGNTTIQIPAIGDHFLDIEKVSPLATDVSSISDKENSRPVSPPDSDKLMPAAVQRTRSGEDMRSFSAGTNINLNLNDDDGWVVKHRDRWSPFQEKIESRRAERIILKPTDLEERHRQASQVSSSNESRSTSMVSPVPPDGIATQDTRNHAVTTLPLPSVQVEGTEIRKSTDLIGLPLALPPALADEGAEYAERARRIFDGDEEDVTKSEAASWMGEKNTLSTRTLHAYMQLFDLSGMNLVTSLRVLASKLLLKGETQQFDRIITTLSSRWCECNPNHGFKAQDVVHTILYSLVLLNTDLHLADIVEKMSKAAYVKNTLPTIRRVVTDAAPDAFDDTIRPSGLQSRPSVPWIDSSLSSNPSSPTLFAEFRSDMTLLGDKKPTASKRLSLRPNMMRQESDGVASDPTNQSNALVNSQWTGTMKGWENEIEVVLKSFFASIRNEPLPLMGVAAEAKSAADRNLSVTNMNGGIKRSGSVISRTPSDNQSQYRSKPGLRTLAMNWQQRNTRSRPNLYPASTLGSSSRTSFDDNNSLWSPAQSSNWSRNSYAKTLTSASVGSLQHYTPAGADFKHSIGFANALSQAIIREESNGDTEAFSLSGVLLDDEALTLEGAPWAKEGLVKHKHHLETADRKAKERNWNDCFAVISKGKLTLFAFGTSTSKSHSMGRKAMNKAGQSGRAASIAGTTVGGGDWMENAEQLETIILRQTIASTLPPPGYSKARPNVWALSLPSGAVHLFQVGTPEIAKEFMTTANYWSARLSKEPLPGGVSNIQYGWSDNIINMALVERRESSFSTPPSSLQNAHPRHMHSPSGSGGVSRPSYQSSLRSSLDTGFGNQRAKLPGDKMQIAEWHPPTQSMMASQLLEVDQLRGLQAYVHGVEDELATHNELKHAIELAFSPRQSNYQRAMANWQRKSDYLLREIVKFSTYIESLTIAQTAKDAFYARKHGTDSSGVPDTYSDAGLPASQQTVAA